jgi:hypothetical protein
MVIYTITIVAWLALPLSTGAVIWPPHVDAEAVYYLVAGAIVAVTVISLWADTGTARGDDCGSNKPGEHANRASD